MKDELKGKSFGIEDTIVISRDYASVGFSDVDKEFQQFLVIGLPHTSLSISNA